MELIKFRVVNFRSIDDSGWIEASNVTALIGTNESGKTNILLALWKLNPASNEGKINLLSDAPRKFYSEYRQGEQKEFFIEAYFELSDEEAVSVSKLRNQTKEAVKITIIKKLYNGGLTVNFPNENPKTINIEMVQKPIIEQIMNIQTTTLLKSENEDKREIFIDKLSSALKQLEQHNFSENSLRQNLESLEALIDDKAPVTSTLTIAIKSIILTLKSSLETIEKPSDVLLQQSRNFVAKNIPKFVYYSNYGNLDSEIYLPHVIDNMTRTDLGTKESAKVKTLKVLFDFVGLEPNDILELGNDSTDEDATDEVLEKIAANKKERSVLLQSASTSLTTKFRDWWKQGEYRFRFEADGDHFRIWVSDDKRPEEIELEGRSTGLQWFLSFYLTFLVESKDAHEGSILLLDEPGLSLHPLAQKDLSQFFENLSISNKILYTTHSPFLIDPNNLDRVKAVYLAKNGTTLVSSNLRAIEENSSQTKSIYPVHAALGLSVSDMFLNNCIPVLIEGPSDQIYFSAIKILLIGLGKIKPKKDIVFIPTGGAKGIKSLVNLISGREEKLPFVVIDSDQQGKQAASNLKNELYSEEASKLISVSEFISLNNAEVEDLMWTELLLTCIPYIINGHNPDILFEDDYDSSQSLVSQIDSFSKKHSIELINGWKVELAKIFKKKLAKAKVEMVPTDVMNNWVAIFERLNT